MKSLINLYFSIRHPSKMNMNLGGSNTSLEIRTKTKPEYRLKKITIQTRSGISQIKFSFDDDKDWCYGQGGGVESSRHLIFGKGEYLVRVTHERMYNYSSAGAFVEFETNKGRVFTYTPGTSWRGLATGIKSEMTTVKAEKGMEIIGLIIRRGILLGTDQQAVPQNELQQGTKKPQQWYVVAYNTTKEDFDVDTDSAEEENVEIDEDVRYQHFSSWLEAMDYWKQTETLVNNKKGRALVLVDLSLIHI